MPQVIYQHNVVGNYTISTGSKSFLMSLVSGALPSTPYRIDSVVLILSRFNVESQMRGFKCTAVSDNGTEQILTTPSLQSLGWATGSGVTDGTFNCSTGSSLKNLTELKFASHKADASSDGTAISIRSASTITLTITYTLLSSTLTLNKSTANLNDTVRANIVGGSSFTHRLTFAMPLATSQVYNLAAGAANLDFVIPLSWLDKIPSSLQGIMTVTLETLSGSTVIGTSSQTCFITIPGYSKPVILGTNLSRCDISGNLSATGTYIRVIMSYSYSSVYGSNTITANIKYRKSGDSAWIAGFTGALASGGNVVIGYDDILTTSSYEVLFSIDDIPSSPSTFTDVLGSGAVFMHKRAGGKGIGFGSYCEADNRLQIANDWEIVGGNYTAGDILSKLLTVDGWGSGLDADKFRGTSNVSISRRTAGNMDVQDTGFYFVYEGITVGTFPASLSAMSKWGILIVYNAMETGADETYANGYVVQHYYNVTYGPSRYWMRQKVTTNPFTQWYMYEGTAD